MIRQAVGNESGSLAPPCWPLKPLDLGILNSLRISIFGFRILSGKEMVTVHAVLAQRGKRTAEYRISNKECRSEERPAAMSTCRSTQYCGSPFTSIFLFPSTFCGSLFDILRFVSSLSLDSRERLQEMSSPSWQPQLDRGHHTTSLIAPGSLWEARRSKPGSACCTPRWSP